MLAPKVLVLISVCVYCYTATTPFQKKPDEQGKFFGFWQNSTVKLHKSVHRWWSTPFRKQTHEKQNPRRNRKGKNQRVLEKHGLKCHSWKTQSTFEFQ